MDDASPLSGNRDEPSGTDAAAPDDGDVLVRDPSEIRDPLPQPLFSWRRLVIVVLVAVAVACIAVAARSGGGSEGEGADAAIVAYDPRPGGQVTRQAPVGVELEPGYDGRLVIDGVAIPEEQMLGAIEPGSEAFEQLPEDQRNLGPRPNNKNLVKYQPGPGKAVSEYDTGAVQITVRFWKVADGPQAARSVTYTIKVF
jgi:hypothetical protein